MKIEPNSCRNGMMRKSLANFPRSFLAIATLALLLFFSAADSCFSQGRVNFSNNTFPALPGAPDRLCVNR